MNERPLYLRAAFHFHAAGMSTRSLFPSPEAERKFAEEAVVRAAAYAVGWLLDRPATHRQIMDFYASQLKRIRR